MYNYNLTEIEMLILLQYQKKEILTDNQRKIILKSLKKTLKKRVITHNRKLCYISYIDPKDNQIIIDSYYIVNMQDFYNIVENLKNTKLKNIEFIISDTRMLYFENSFNENKYYFWTHKTLLNEINKWGLRSIIKKEKINKKFDRLEKFLNILKDTPEKTKNDWMQDTNLDKVIKIMKQFNCEMCFKFWKYNDTSENFFPVFYSNWTIKEYISQEKHQALLKI